MESKGDFMSRDEFERRLKKIEEERRIERKEMASLIQTMEGFTENQNTERARKQDPKLIDMDEFDALLKDVFMAEKNMLDQALILNNCVDIITMKNILTQSRTPTEEQFQKVEETMKGILNKRDRRGSASHPTKDDPIRNSFLSLIDSVLTEIPCMRSYEIGQNKAYSYFVYRNARKLSSKIFNLTRQPAYSKEFLCKSDTLKQRTHQNLFYASDGIRRVNLLSTTDIESIIHEKLSNRIRSKRAREKRKNTSQRLRAAGVLTVVNNNNYGTMNNNYYNGPGDNHPVEELEDVSDEEPNDEGHSKPKNDTELENSEFEEVSDCESDKENHKELTNYDNLFGDLLFTRNPTDISPFSDIKNTSSSQAKLENSSKRTIKTEPTESTVKSSKRALKTQDTSVPSPTKSLRMSQRSEEEEEDEDREYMKLLAKEKQKALAAAAKLAEDKSKKAASHLGKSTRSYSAGAKKKKLRL